MSGKILQVPGESYYKGMEDTPDTCVHKVLGAILKHTSSD